MVAFFQQVGGADDRMFFAPVRAATRADKEARNDADGRRQSDGAVDER